MPTPEEILEELKNIKYPGYSRDIVSFGMVRDIEIATAGITVTLTPGAANPEAVQQIVAEVHRRVSEMTGVEQVEIAVQQPDRPRPREAGRQADIPGIRHIVAVASGKGGVGKSTVAVNLALALRGMGYRVGLLDADVYGPSVPVMLGLTERPRTGANERILPIEKFGIKIISLGLFIQDRTAGHLARADDQQAADPVPSRRRMGRTRLPRSRPAAGHRRCPAHHGTAGPLAGGVIVTTPQDVALLDVQRGVTMFSQVNAPVLGVVENMSYHICRKCGHRAEIFGHGGGARMAAEAGVPFLGEIPLERAIRESGDGGEPIVVAAPESPQSEAFRDIARQVVHEIEGESEMVLPTIH